ncbi:MAG: hypothetical protein LUQ66_03130 [Methanoregula sp.]|nr:hypothetical protein [Methanoregula sp.]
MAKSVFPHPGPPLISDGRPFGSPPPVISSKPLIPEGIFSNSSVPANMPVLFFPVRFVLHHCPYSIDVTIICTAYIIGDVWYVLSGEVPVVSERE